MNKLFIVSISCLIAVFGVNLVVSQAQPQQQQGMRNFETETFVFFFL